MARFALILVTLAALLLGLPAAALAETPAPPVEVSPAPGGSADPGGEVTPDPGGEVTPDPGGEVTPDPGGEVTPDPGGEVTPDPGSSADPGGEASLPPAIEIRGVVRNPDGTPAAGASVYGESAAGTTSAVTTADDGAFALFANVEPGTLVRIDAQGPFTEIPGDDAVCTYFVFTFGIAEVEVIAEGVSGVEIVLGQEGQTAMCPETGGPNAGSEGPQATLPPTDVAVAASSSTVPVPWILVASATAIVIFATARRRAPRP